MRMTSILAGAILSAICALAGQARGPISPAAAASAVTGVDHLDPAFGDRGVARLTSPASGASFSALALQPDGKIVVAGQYRDHMLVARYTAAGALDPGFGGTGVVTATIGLSYAAAVAIQPDNKILVGGSASNDFALVRYSAAGIPDAGFGSAGVVTTSLGLQSADAIAALALQADGKIVVAGTLSSSGGADSGAVVLARYTAGGALDPGFSGGIVTTNLGYNLLPDTPLTIQPDGKIVVAGQFGQTDIGVERFTATGVPDASFGINGTVTTNLGPNTFAYASALALQPDGKIVAAGTMMFPGPPSFFALVRYTSNGRLDASFGDGGIVFTAINGADNRARALALQPDGKLVVGGPSSTFCSLACDWRFTLARYQRDGRLDRSFGGVGSITSDLFGRIAALGLQPDGKIVAAGTATAPPIVGQPPVALLARFVDNAGSVYLPLAHR